MINLIILSLVIIVLFIFIKNGQLIRYINRISQVVKVFLYKQTRPLKNSMNGLDNSTRRIYIIVIFLTSLLVMTGAVYLQTPNRDRTPTPVVKGSPDIEIDSINNFIDKHF